MRRDKRQKRGKRQNGVKQNKETQAEGYSVVSVASVVQETASYQNSYQGAILELKLTNIDCAYYVLAMI